MKKIKLINHEQARALFISNRWINIDDFCISIGKEEKETILVNANEANSEAIGDFIKVNVGTEYHIPLSEFDNEIEVSLNDIKDLGALLSLNKKPYLLRVYRSATEEKINKIGILYSELRIIDFGTGWNETIQNLQCIASCKDLNIINLDGCENLRDISLLPNFKKLSQLFIDGFKDLSQLKYISECKNLQINLFSLDLSRNEKLVDITPISEFYHLKKLNLSNCKNLTDLSPLSGLKNLESLDLSRCENLTDLFPIGELSALKSLDLSQCKNIADLTPLKELKVLSSLNLWICGNIKNFSPLGNLKALNWLSLGYCKNLTNLEPLKELTALKYLCLESCENITDLSILKCLNSLNHLILSYCNSINDLSILNDLKSLIRLDLISCKNITDLSILSSLSNLNKLELSFCENITSLNPLSELVSLNSIVLNGCSKVIFIKPLLSLNLLSSISLDDCSNIRDFESLSSLPQLRELNWVNPVACTEILMQSACNRSDSAYIEENMNQWIYELELSKDANIFALKLLNCLSHTDKTFQLKFLQEISTKIRSRGMQSEDKNDIENYTWEKWCSHVVNHPLEKALECLESAINELDVFRETESLLGPIILAYSELADLHTFERDFLLQRVKNVLHIVDEHNEELRQIAPSAAVFYATLKMREEVLFWLAKATDQKESQWREKVILALVKHYSRKENFSEARRLLNEMKTQDQKDLAIAFIAENMAHKYPLEAGFLLDEIKDLQVSSHAAQKMLRQPAMFTKPQSIYQLLLHLQATPIELATCLEFIIENDITGKFADTLRSLFVQNVASAPSPSKLLELCEHKAVGEFVKPRTLLKFKIYLKEKTTEENVSAIPLFISELQKHELIDSEEAAELSKLMKM
jgi:hypothetical protein